MFFPHLADSLYAINRYSLCGPVDYLGYHDVYRQPSDNISRSLLLEKLATHFRKSEKELQSALKEHLLLPVQNPPDLEKPEYKEFLMYLYFYGAEPEPLKADILNRLSEYKVKHAHGYKELYGDADPETVFSEILLEWSAREQNESYQGWPGRLVKARENMQVLQEYYGEEIDPCCEDTADSALLEKTFGFLVDAYKKPLVFHDTSKTEKTVLQLLQHYYRRPGYQRVVASLGLKPAVVTKANYGCNYALRAHNNVLWYIELLEQSGLEYFSEEEKQLLPCAAIYLNAATGDVDHASEAVCGAEYFRRDLAPFFSSELVSDIAAAIEHKEDDVQQRDNKVQEKVRLYLRVLRFADRMDSVRCSTVSSGFPAWSENLEGESFNPALLDLLLPKRSFVFDPKRENTFPASPGGRYAWSD